MMKKVTMLVFILTLCITGIASAVEIPACFAVSCDTGVDDTIILTAYDENGEMVDLSEFTVIETGFQDADADPSGFAIGDGYDSEYVDGAIHFTMIEAFYNHNRWSIGGFVEGGVEFNYWLVVPESLLGCDDCGDESNNFPGEHRFVVDIIAAGGTCDFISCGDPTIVVGDAEIAEEGATSAVLQIQLDRNPTADVTITIAEPLDPVDPNFTDLNSFTIADAVDGVLTVVIPADSNSTSFTVTAFDDDIIEGDLGYGLVVESTMAPGAGYDPNLVTGPDEDPNSTAIVSGGLVTVIDNDVRTVVVDPELVELSEGDPNVWVPVNVTLSHMPKAGTVVNVAVGMAELAWDLGMVKTDADLEDPNYLTFNETNWDEAQTISFAAIAVEGRAGEEPGQSHIPADCILTPSSDDPGYDPETGIEPGAVIAISVEDIDCGSYGFDPRDYNEDCFVNLADFAIFAQGWMLCTDPGNPDCAVVEEE